MTRRSHLSAWIVEKVDDSTGIGDFRSWVRERFRRGLKVENDVSSSTLNALFIGFWDKTPSYPVLIQTRGKKISAFKRSDAVKRSPRSIEQTWSSRRAKSAFKRIRRGHQLTNKVRVR